MKIEVKSWDKERNSENDSESRTTDEDDIFTLAKFIRSEYNS